MHAYHRTVTAPRLAILTTFEGDLPFTARHPDDGAKVTAGLAPHLPGWAFDTWRVSAGEWPADPTPELLDELEPEPNPAQDEEDRP